MNGGYIFAINVPSNGEGCFPTRSIDFDDENVFSFVQRTSELISAQTYTRSPNATADQLTRCNNKFISQLIELLLSKSTYGKDWPSNGRM